MTETASAPTASPAEPFAHDERTEPVSPSLALDGEHRGRTADASAAPVELVVLVDDDGTPTGTTDKATVHTTDTPLHLAFSCHLYDSDGRVLVTRRALGKLTWAGVWTNSFCGHLSPGESAEGALRRRGLAELGVTVTAIRSVLPDFRYRAVDASGIVENEICPVFSAVTTDAVVPNPDEVSEWQWVSPAELREAVAAAPFAFSPWLGWQLEQLDTPDR